MKRRDFIKTTLVAGAAALTFDSVLAHTQNPVAAARKIGAEPIPDLVAVRG